jgi:hypothetical protein
MTVNFFYNFVFLFLIIDFAPELLIQISKNSKRQFLALRPLLGGLNL